MDKWVSETLSDNGQLAFYKAARERQEAKEHDRRAFNRLGYFVGFGGLAGGLMAMAAALIVAVKMPPEQPQKYVLVDKASGAIVAAVDAKDAPLLYPESVRYAELRELLIACEGYIPQSWAKADFHLCMIRLTADEQKRRILDIGVDGQRYPPRLFGPTGYAMPSDFPLGAFVKLATTGNPPNEVYHYAVRYERTEVMAGVEQHARYTADVVFTFRPDLKINGTDALANPSRMQVISFSTIKDRT
jgi:type IV secretory pathway component VirB8